MSNPYSQVVYLGDACLETPEHSGGGPGPGEVSLHIASTGICGTDLHILHGEMDQRVDMPAVSGHETSGAAEALKILEDCGGDTDS